MKRINQRARLQPDTSAMQACDRHHPERLSPPRFEPVSTQWTASNQTKTAPWAHAFIYSRFFTKIRYGNVLMSGTQFANCETKFLKLKLKGMQR